MNRLLSRMLVLGLVLSLVATGNVASAETFPTKPVRIVSDSAPGSAPDVLLRIISERLTQLWGQQVVTVNQPGAGGALAARAASSALPDGHTLFMVGTAAFVAPPGVAPNIPVRVPRDFLPISIVGEHPMFITVAPATGITNLDGLIAAAKQRPNELVFASTGRGRFSHLTGEMLQNRTSIKLLMVPYAGGPLRRLTMFWADVSML
jgi:tripartite-type tricarboxylate transporter receptor subunit TctC